MSQDSNLMRHLASDVKRNRIASDQTLKCAKQQAKVVEGLGTIQIDFYMVQCRVSNGTGQCNFSGQRDNETS